MGRDWTWSRLLSWGTEKKREREIRRLNKWKSLRSWLTMIALDCVFGDIDASSVRRSFHQHEDLTDDHRERQSRCTEGKEKRFSSYLTMWSLLVLWDSHDLWFVFVTVPLLRSIFIGRSFDLDTEGKVHPEVSIHDSNLHGVFIFVGLDDRILVVAGRNCFVV